MTERDVKFIRSSIIEILSKEYIQSHYGVIDSIQIGIIENTAQLIINDLVIKRIAFDCGETDEPV